MGYTSRGFAERETSPRARRLGQPGMRMGRFASPPECLVDPFESASLRRLLRRARLRV